MAYISEFFISLFKKIKRELLEARLSCIDFFLFDVMLWSTAMLASYKRGRCVNWFSLCDFAYFRIEKQQLSVHPNKYNHEMAFI